MAIAGSIVQTSGGVNTPSVATSTTALTANEERLGWSIQNQDTSVLKVCLGGTASSTVYHVILKACSSAADGTGGILNMTSGVVFTGKVTVYSSGTPSYTVLDISP